MSPGSQQMGDDAQLLEYYQELRNTNNPGMAERDRIYAVGRKIKLVLEETDDPKVVELAIKYDLPELAHLTYNQHPEEIVQALIDNCDDLVIIKELYKNSQSEEYLDKLLSSHKMQHRELSGRPFLSHLLSVNNFAFVLSNFPDHPQLWETFGPGNMDPIDKLLGEMLGMSDQFIRIELPHLLELLGPRLYDSPVTIDRINITARGVFMEHFLKHPDQFARAAGNMDAITRAMVIAADENGSEELAELILRYVHSSGLDRYSVYMDNPGLWYNAAAKTGRREMLRMLLPREKAIFDAIDAGEAADSVGDDGLLTILEDLAK